MALQDTCHTGAGDKEKGFSKRAWFMPLKALLSSSIAYSQPIYQLSQGPVTTSPGSRLSQELSVDPTDRLWFSGIPESHRRKGEARQHNSLASLLIQHSWILKPLPTVPMS